AAYGDLDNDGDLDLVINNVNMVSFIYENQTDSLTENHYLKLRFEGPEKNKFAVGTAVNLYYDNNVVYQELIPSTGFQSSMDYEMTIGLGKATSVDSLRVIWPDDKTQKMENLEADQTVNLSYSEAREVYTPAKPDAIKPLLKEVENSNLLAHEENNYNDFDYEGLIYKLLSQEGPALAIGDINGDGNEDVFLGGAAGQEAMLYEHTGNGNIRPMRQSVFNEDRTYEDTAAAIFDADGDGDMDLMVGAGGNQVGDERTYRARLYLNDGKGKFSKSEQQLPSTFKNISTIAPFDYDDDGDMDVFIGSRSVVGTYGVDPDHLFLENLGNAEFKDATERLAYDLKDAGMVTNAIWADMDGDSRKDLVTVSEWGTPRIFRNSGRRLAKMSSSLDSLDGLWNVVEAADLDNDGDLDLVLGNQGANLHYKPTPANPMKMWINDFDGNGTIEQIVTLSENGKDYPLHQKKELTNQIVSLKKQNLKASEYARKTIGELWPKSVFENSIMKKSGTSESVIAINEGNGKFKIKTLPSRVQLSCVCGISCADVNNDGYLDLIMGGNNFEFKPQFSRLDANYGNVLLGNKELDFKWEGYNKSGFFIRDEIKHIKQFKDRNGRAFVIAALNDTKPKIYSLDD
ncbi:MAG: VCBS repeat-containing protein, partial [Muriicola sp.]|nr:VCBS repeat-containing protein [Muriicola sp.]NNK34993.1 CRTAC1 family protein [Eudoraea sp.]